MIDYQKLIEDLDEECELANEDKVESNSLSYNNSYAQGYDTGYYEGLCKALYIMKGKNND